MGLGSRGRGEGAVVQDRAAGERGSCQPSWVTWRAPVLRQGATSIPAGVREAGRRGGGRSVCGEACSVPRGDRFGVQAGAQGVQEVAAGIVQGRVMGAWNSDLMLGLEKAEELERNEAKSAECGDGEKCPEHLREVVHGAVQVLRSGARGTATPRCRVSWETLSLPLRPCVPSRSGSSVPTRKRVIGGRWACSAREADLGLVRDKPNHTKMCSSETLAGPLERGRPRSPRVRPGEGPSLSEDAWSRSSDFLPAPAGAGFSCEGG